jgi:FAD/FMN-containing dehydrogenase
VTQIAEDFAPDLASTDPSELDRYGRDWVSLFPPRASMLCRPRTIDELSRLLRLCNEHAVPVVPSGGRTGLCCGALAASGEVVIALERMAELAPVDTVGCTVRVQAGATFEAVQRHCAEAGLVWPVDLESDGSQIGGILATNASGMRVIRYGLADKWVLGLTAVLATGDVLELNGALEKSTTGIDMRQLFIGSEGILGVIAAATLKLTTPTLATSTHLIGLPSWSAVMQLFDRARNAPFELRAFESFSRSCLERVLAHSGLECPLAATSAHYLLIEAAPGKSSAAEWLASSAEPDGVYAATDSGSAERLWALRLGIDPAIYGAGGAVCAHTVAVPVACLSSFYEEIDEILTRDFDGWERFIYCHVGDGALHVRLPKPDDMERRDFRVRSRAFERAMFERVRAYGGSVSAEHGIGILKKGWLKYTRSPAEIDAMRTLKKALDPKGILNPGKVL